MPKTKQLLALAVATAIAGTTMLGVTSATSDYMHYQDGTISICDPSSNGTKCITMQDKNLGASEAGTGTSSYGYHFQWGNNHGFEIGCYENGCSDTVTNSATNTLAIWSTDYNHVGYNGTLFIKGTSSSKSDYWSDNTPSNHNGLRGGENDSAENNYGFDETNNVARNVENRRGPCEDGYHVPSIGEWNQVLEYWAEENEIELEDDGGLKYNNTTLDGLKFQEDFKIPFAVYRDGNDAKVYGMGDRATLWSSSPSVGSDYARRFYFNPNRAYASHTYNRTHAYSLRCFKDSYLSFPSSEGGEPQVIVNIGEFNGGKNTCTGENYIFSGIVAGPSLITRALTKTFQCAFGESRATSVTIQLSGDLVDANGNTISSGNVKIKNSAWTSTPTGVKSSDNVITEYTGLNKTVTLFNKAANIIGTAVGNGVDIQLEILGGTPDGTYNGTLVLTY